MFLSFYLVLSNLKSQTTYNRIIDLEFGIENAFLDFELENETLHILVKHTCFPNSDTTICLSLNEVSQNGSITKSDIYEYFGSEGNNSLFFLDSSFVISGHQTNKFDGRPTNLLVTNTSGAIDSIYRINGEINGEIPNNQGVIEDEQYLFLYGNLVDFNNGVQWSHISKIDKSSLDTIWEKKYKREFENTCLDLQTTLSNQLIYLNKFNSVAGPQGEDGYQINYLNKESGEIENYYEVTTLNIRETRTLLATKDGIYFCTDDALNGDWPFNIAFGTLNKLSTDFNSVLWSFKLPFTTFSTSWYDYNVYDIIEANNGDIIICGSVRISTENSGFIARITSNGILKWLKNYRINNSTDVQSNLLKVIETNTGGLKLGGNVQQIGPNGLNFDLWLLSTDANGCIEGEECEEIIFLDGVDNSIPQFNIGDQWTYTYFDHGWVDAKFHDFRVYTIIDSLLWNGKSAFVIEPGAYTEKDYMHIDSSKVYFWDEQIQDYQLTYDFKNDSFYAVAWKDENGLEGIAEFAVDSISSVLGDESLLNKKYISISSNGSEIDTIHREVIKNIGFGYGGLKAPIGRSIYGQDYSIGVLRCFSNDSINMNFVNYPCDSTWIEFTPTINLQQSEKLIVQPNPASDEFTIIALGKGVLEIHDINGKVLQTLGITSKGNYTLNSNNFSSGIYIVTLKSDNVFYSNKLIIQNQF